MNITPLNLKRTASGPAGTAIRKQLMKLTNCSHAGCATPDCISIATLLNFRWPLGTRITGKVNAFAQLAQPGIRFVVINEAV